MTDEVRRNHFQHLNQVPQSEFGERWEINKVLWWEHLETFAEVLGFTATPEPGGADGWATASFYSPEFRRDDITTKYTKDGDRYFCEIVRYPGGIDAAYHEMGWDGSRDWLYPFDAARP
jgi:hypothetical protein